MKDLDSRVAVITGAASGIGRALAILCAKQRMRLVLADVDATGLQGTAALVGEGVETLLAPCDVSRPDAVARVADDTYRRFGAAHLLANNAGVGVGGPIWTTTPEDWEWVMGVNLMGVVHGIRSFVPRMLAQGDECHIVNTASVSGLLSVPNMSVYCASKHSVVVVSECLHHELRQAGAKIGVSVLCPAYVNTNIADAARNRPPELAAANPLAAEAEERTRRAIRSGRVTAAEVAAATLEAVKTGRFYVLTHPRIKPAVEMRMRDILEERTPENPMP
jgi:NAD(P)-dependent dehydrogenase (short-subunit alcohol dehydrogenase family)